MLPTVPFHLLISLSALLVSGVSSDTTKDTSGPVSPRPRPPTVLTDPSWALGLRLYQALRSSNPGAINTLISPLLLASSLEALAGGSGGVTSSQLKDLLKTPSPSKAEGAGELLSQALKAVGKSNGSSFDLRSSSAVFSKEAPPVDLAFVKGCQERFALSHQPLGKGDSKADLKKLQAWVKAGLGGIEVAPVEANIQAEAGALILANVLHFKGLWEREFSEDIGDRRTFLGTSYTQVEMMHRAGLCRHYEDMENMVQVLELRLMGGKASLLLLLPFHVERLARLDKLLTLDLLNKWLDKATEMSMAISLPKVNISSTLSLKEQLSALGVAAAWDRKTADFSGASAKSQGKLHLGGALHWASLELGPQAGQGAGDLEDENLGRPKLFYADHSFILLVRDNETGALVLMGALDHVEGEPLHDEL